MDDPFAAARILQTRRTEIGGKFPGVSLFLRKPMYPRAGYEPFTWNDNSFVPCDMETFIRNHKGNEDGRVQVVRIDFGSTTFAIPEGMDVDLWIDSDKASYGFEEGFHIYSARHCYWRGKGARKRGCTHRSARSTSLSPWQNTETKSCSNNFYSRMNAPINHATLSSPRFKVGFFCPGQLFLCYVRTTISTKNVALTT